MNDIIKFITTTVSTTVNSQGDYPATRTDRNVFVLVKSIGTKEFYEAATAGMKPEIKFVIQDYLDYEGEKELAFNGFRYQILRTYRTQNNQLEITAGGGVRDIAHT
jgi:phage head-tail adaptor, putative, SPP1 family